MKQIITVLFLSILYQVHAQNDTNRLSFYGITGQKSTDRLATYENHGQYIRLIMDRLHMSIYKKEFAGLQEDYVFWIYFQIDTTGKVVNLRAKHKPGVPDIVIEYGYKLLKKTDGQWNPEVKNCQQVLSDTIICQFEITKKNRPKDISFFLELLEGNHEYVLTAWRRKNVCDVALQYE